MSIIIDAGQVIEAAENRGIDAQAIEDAVKSVAQQIADHDGLTLFDVSNQPGFGGLCASFHPGTTTECPADLQEMDEGGEL